MRILAAAVAATAVTVLAACADTDAAAPPAATPSPSATGTTISITEPLDELTITFDADGKGSSVKTWTLRCAPPGGDHPAAADACTQLAKADKPFAPLPADAMCTEIYGGPSVATIKGTWKGEPVDARYTRENGCNISRWDAVAKAISGKPVVQ